MTGLLDPINSGASPEGLMPQGHAVNTVCPYLRTTP